MSEQEKTVSPEHEFLGVGKSAAYGLQHVLTMYGGIIAPPLIVGTAAGLSGMEIGLLIAAALFVGGLATILQTAGVKYVGARLPLVQGVSFAGVATMVAIVTTGPSVPLRAQILSTSSKRMFSILKPTFFRRSAMMFWQS